MWIRFHKWWHKLRYGKKLSSGNNTRKNINKNIIARIPYIDLVSVKSINKELQKCHKRLLEDVMNKNIHEIVYIWDEHQSLLKSIVSSDKNSQDIIELPMYIKYDSAPNKYILMHNHPNNKPFSLIDLNTFVNYDSIHILTVVRHDANIYLIKKMKNYDKESFIEYIDKINELFYLNRIDMTTVFDEIRHNRKSFGIDINYIPHI